MCLTNWPLEGAVSTSRDLQSDHGFSQNVPKGFKNTHAHKQVHWVNWNFPTFQIRKHTKHFTEIFLILCWQSCCKTKRHQLSTTAKIKNALLITYNLIFEWHRLASIIIITYDHATKHEAGHVDKIASYLSKTYTVLQSTAEMPHWPCSLDGEGALDKKNPKLHKPGKLCREQCLVETRAPFIPADFSVCVCGVFCVRVWV